MSFHFASIEYANCFRDLPTPDIPKLKQSAIDYLESVDQQSWYEDPVSHGLVVLLKFAVKKLLCPKYCRLLN